MERNNYPEKYRHDLEVVRGTAEQLKKDFAIFGMTISVSGNEKTAYDELKKQVIPFVENFFQNKKESFLSLLYRIDVNESSIKEAMEIKDSNLRLESIAHLIVEREFMKVLTRKLFSGSGN